MFDKNKNGYIDGGELKALVEKQLERKVNYNEFEEHMKTIDLNRDGRLNLCEYLNSVLGKDWKVMTDGDWAVPRSECGINEMPAEAERVYNEIGMIPLICGKDEASATAVSVE